VHLQIAIDGPAASGKTTVARLVAERLGVLYLDTGAMYRALAYAALRTQTDLDNENALVRLCAQHRIAVTLDRNAPLGFRIFAGERELTQSDLESSEVTSVVSTIAAHPRVREAMVLEQRRIAQAGPVVMAGRDIGTVVLPDAQVKIYLTASVEARVARRRAQLEEAGVDVSTHELTKEIEERDRLDETRASSPLRKAADALVIDSSGLSIDDVVSMITDMAAPLGPSIPQGDGSIPQGDKV
jgi:cytidylate kinase